jgi:hypothetical protein
MKIVFFIYRTSFINNWVQKLKPFFDDKNVEVNILCLDNSYKDYNDYKEYNIINISKLNSKQIKNLLTEINPKAVILLGYRSLMEMLLVRISKLLNIGLIYIQHGVLDEEDLKTFSGKSKLEMIKSFKKQIKYLNLFLQLIFIKNVNFKNEFKILFNAVFFANYKNIGFDKFLIFSENGNLFHKKLFQYDDSQLDIIGYPVFTHSKFNSLDLVLNKDLTKKYILYIHQNFIDTNLTSINYDEEKTYILSLSKICIKYGYQFLIQLHPLDNIKKYKDLYAFEDISFVQNGNIPDLVFNSTMVFGHFSTAMFIPILLNKPLVVLTYPKILFQYDHLFDNVGIHIKNSQELNLMLGNTTEFKNLTSNYDSFRKLNLGNSNSFEDYSNSILEFINTH